MRKKKTGLVALIAIITLLAGVIMPFLVAFLR